MVNTSFEHRNGLTRCGVGLIHLLKAQLSLDFSAGFHCKGHPYLGKDDVLWDS
jgi:hypothetical protein